MINSIYLTFCKIRFQLSRLWMPIEPIVYDTHFKPGEETDEYQRFIVTRERKSYRLWYISFRVLEPLSIERLSLFDSKLAAILAARSGDRYSVWAIEALLSRKHVLPISDELALESKACIVAMADGLDEFDALERCWPGYLEYTTKHGERCLSVDDPSKCQFEITQIDDVSDGFAVADQLPYFVSFESNEYPAFALIVNVSPWHQGYTEALAAGYDDAVPLKCPSTEDLYIEDLKMLDTEYAAMLAQQSAEEDLVES